MTIMTFFDATTGRDYLNETLKKTMFTDKYNKYNILLLVTFLLRNFVRIQNMSYFCCSDQHRTIYSHITKNWQILAYADLKSNF